MGLMIVVRHGLMTDIKVGSITESDTMFDFLRKGYRNVEGVGDFGVRKCE